MINQFFVHWPSILWKDKKYVRFVQGHGKAGFAPLSAGFCVCYLAKSFKSYESQLEHAENTRTAFLREGESGLTLSGESHASVCVIEDIVSESLCACNRITQDNLYVWAPVFIWSVTAGCLRLAPRVLEYVICVCTYLKTWDSETMVNANNETNERERQTDWQRERREAEWISSAEWGGGKRSRKI